MKKIMGEKMGLLSNIVIFIHTFGSAVTLFLFASEFLFSSSMDIIQLNYVIQEDTF